MNKWWTNFFDDNFAHLLLERADKDYLQQQVSFIIDELALKPSAVLFDQCCGTGELSLAMARKGIQVIGVDQSQSYILHAEKKAKNEGLGCAFYCADAFDFVPKLLCDAAVNWYTSFGYSDDDSVNQKMLQRVYQCLKYGGKFILDYTNPTFIFKNFSAQEMLQAPMDKDVSVIKESQVDMERDMFQSSWTYLLPNGERIIKTAESRIYFARDLKHMLENCGFHSIRFMGGIAKKLTKDSARCIVIAEK